MAADSPSLLLQRAADTLSEMAELASPPQWKADDLTDAGHPGVWWVRADYEDETSTGSHCVAELETVNPKADAAWIAAMSPAVAAPLVAWLRYAQAQYEVGERRTQRYGFGSVDNHVSESDRAALGFAHLVLGLSEEDA